MELSEFEEEITQLEMAMCKYVRQIEHAHYTQIVFYTILESTRWISPRYSNSIESFFVHSYKAEFILKHLYIFLAILITTACRILTMAYLLVDLEG